MRPPTISRLIRLLEAEDLVLREPDPDDARIQWLTATWKGCRVLDEGRPLDYFSGGR